jgi:hypothetical protein
MIPKQPDVLSSPFQHRAFPDPPLSSTGVKTRQAQLRKFAKTHLLYEVEQLEAITMRLLELWEHDGRIGHRDLNRLDMETRNAQVESFAINARALYDFFFSEPHGDDASARHYVASGAWQPPEVPEALAPVRRRVGKEIAHMTYHRTKLADDARQWKYAEIWRAFGDVLRAFVVQAAPELLPRDVARRIEELASPLVGISILSTVAASATNSLPIVMDADGLATYRSPPVIEDVPGTATYRHPSIEDEPGPAPHLS